MLAAGVQEDFNVALGAPAEVGWGVLPFVGTIPSALMIFLQSFDAGSEVLFYFLDAGVCELLCAIFQAQTRSFLDDLFINELMGIYLIRRLVC